MSHLSLTTDEPDPRIDVVVAKLKKTHPGWQTKRPMMVEPTYRAVDVSGFEIPRPVRAQDAYVLSDQVEHLFDVLRRPDRVSHLSAAWSPHLPADLGLQVIACRYASRNRSNSRKHSSESNQRRSLPGMSVRGSPVRTILP